MAEEQRKKHVIRLEHKVTLGMARPDVHLDKRRAAIKAALQAATAGLAATTAGLAAQAIPVADDGGAPPWGEVIIEPIWYEKNPTFGDILIEAAEVSFWE
ncbi:MAG TPA: hypothetical protein VH640_31230 [Bryobacteraceae bacterium]|jgi:hypothetical protein